MRLIPVVICSLLLIICCNNKYPKKNQSSKIIGCKGLSLKEMELTDMQENKLRSYLSQNFVPPQKTDQICFIPSVIETHKGKKIGLYETKKTGSHLPFFFILKHIDDSIDIISKVATHSNDTTVTYFIKKHENILSKKSKKEINEVLNQ